jgi:hypothetical protein
VAVINQNLLIDAGATFAVGYYYTNDDGTKFDLTGYTASAMFKLYPLVSGATSALTVTPTIDVATGYVEMKLTAAQTATLTSPVYKWSMELTSSSNVIRFVEGYALVSAEVVK